MGAGWHATGEASSGGGGAGDIESVTAGDGLTGGGTSGAVELAADLGSAAPTKQGTAAAGTATAVAREDHVHPWRSRYAVGPFKAANLPASSTVNMGYAVTSSTAEQWAIQPRAGKITHITCDSQGLVSAGSYQVQVRTIGPAGSATVFSAAGEVLTINSSSGRRTLVALSTPISVAAGDAIGAQLVSDGSLSPTTLDPVVTVMLEED